MYHTFIFDLSHDSLLDLFELLLTLVLLAGDDLFDQLGVLLLLGHHCVVDYLLLLLKLLLENLCAGTVSSRLQILLLELLVSLRFLILIYWVRFLEVRKYLLLFGLVKLWFLVLRVSLLLIVVRGVVLGCCVIICIHLIHTIKLHCSSA